MIMGKTYKDSKKFKEKLKREREDSSAERRPKLIKSSKYKNNFETDQD